MAIAAGGLMLVRVVYRWRRGFDGLGLGDVKLAAAGGAWVGLTGLSTFLLLACSGAIIFLLGLKFFKRKDIGLYTRLPFGTFLAPAIWLTWMAGHRGLLG